jgi:hypothetical protein
MVVVGQTNRELYEQIMLLTYSNLEFIFGSMLGLFLASAGARGLRFRTYEGALFVIGAFLAFLYLIVIGEVIHPLVHESGKFIRDSFAMAVSRVFNVGLGFGGATVALRAIAGMERRLLGITEGEV